MDTLTGSSARIAPNDRSTHWRTTSRLPRSPSRISWRGTHDDLYTLYTLYTHECVLYCIVLYCGRVVSVSKQRVNFTVDPQNAEFLRQHHNASALVNRLVTEYRNGGGAETVILDYRIEELAGEISSLESQVESKRERYDELRSRKQRLLSNIDRDLQPIADDLAEKPEFVTSDNPRIQDVAVKHDLPPSAAAERIMELIDA